MSTLPRKCPPAGVQTFGTPRRASPAFDDFGFASDSRQMKQSRECELEAPITTYITGRSSALAWRSEISSISPILIRAHSLSTLFLPVQFVALPLLFGEWWRFLVGAFGVVDDAR